MNSRTHTRSTLPALLLAALTMLVAGCATRAPEYVYGPVVEAAPRGSVHVHPAVTARHVAGADALLTRLISETLRNKGYVTADTEPALELFYEVRVRLERGVEQTPIITARGTYQRTEFFEQHNGTIAVLLQDRASGKVLYTASVSGEVDPKISDEALRGVIETLLARLPAQGEPAR